jgi:hypothetical protein
MVTIRTPGDFDRPAAEEVVTGVTDAIEAAVDALASYRSTWLE